MVTLQHKSHEYQHQRSNEAICGRVALGLGNQGRLGWVAGAVLGSNAGADFGFNVSHWDIPSKVWSAKHTLCRVTELLRRQASRALARVSHV